MEEVLGPGGEDDVGVTCRGRGLRDESGRVCAYFDSTLIYPSNILDTESGVNVLDMSDPTHPALTDRLLTPAMQSPHESLLVNQRRGLLGAVLGNPAFYPGEFDLYDVSQNCRHPACQSCKKRV